MEVDVLPGDQRQPGVDSEAGLQCGERPQEVRQVRPPSHDSGGHQRLPGNFQEVFQEVSKQKFTFDLVCSLYQTSFWSTSILTLSPGKHGGYSLTITLKPQGDSATENVPRRTDGGLVL